MVCLEECNFLLLLLRFMMTLLCGDSDNEDDDICDVLHNAFMLCESDWGVFCKFRVKFVDKCIVGDLVKFLFSSSLAMDVNCRLLLVTSYFTGMCKTGMSFVLSAAKLFCYCVEV